MRASPALPALSHTSYCIARQTAREARPIGQLTRARVLGVLGNPNQKTLLFLYAKNERLQKKKIASLMWGGGDFYV